MSLTLIPQQWGTTWSFGHIAIEMIVTVFVQQNWSIIDSIDDNKSTTTLWTSFCLQSSLWFLFIATCVSSMKKYLTQDFINDNVMTRIQKEPHQFLVKLNHSLLYFKRRCLPQTSMKEEQQKCLKCEDSSNAPGPPGLNSFTLWN